MTASTLATNPEKTRAPVRRWTPKEDETLRNGVLNYLRRNEQPKFSEICKTLSDRTVKQAKERWRNSLNPSITKGLWCTEEVVQLLDLIIEKGENWTDIQQVLSHRSMHCIKSKGRKLLGEAISKKLKKACGGKITKVWEDEERERLFKLHAIHKYDMEAICFGLKSGKSIAEAHRELVLKCPCEECTSKLKSLKATNLSFKLAWAVCRAEEIKDEIARGEFKQRRRSRQKLKKQTEAKPVSRKRSHAEISSVTKPQAVEPALDSDCSSEFSSDFSSDFGSLDCNFLDDDLTLDDIELTEAATAPLCSADSLYANILKDAKSAKRSFAPTKSSAVSTVSPMKMQKISAESFDMNDLDLYLNGPGLIEPEDELFGGEIPCNIEPVSLVEHPTTTSRRRPSVVSAMSCLQQHCISVN